MWSLSVRKSGMFTSHLYEMWQDLIFQQNVKFRNDWNLIMWALLKLIMMWRVFLWYEKLNILVSTFEKYLKMLLFYPVQQISYVSLAYFTANHSFLHKAGMHPVFPQKVTNINTCPQWYRKCQQCRWLQQVIGYWRLSTVLKIRQKKTSIVTPKWHF